MFMLIKVKPNTYVNTDHVEGVMFYNDPSEYRSLFRVVSPNPIDSGPCALVYTSRFTCEVSETAARGLLEFMEVNESLVFDSAPAPTPDLKSQIAVILRDTWRGASLYQLDAIFPDAGEQVIAETLVNLHRENVVLPIPQPNNAPALWYHRSSSEAQEYLRKQQKYTSRHFADYGKVNLCGYVRPDRTQYSSCAVEFVDCTDCLSILATPSPDPSTEGEALPDAPDQVAEYSDSKADPKTEN